VEKHFIALGVMSKLMEKENIVPEYVEMNIAKGKTIHNISTEARASNMAKIGKRKGEKPSLETKEFAKDVTNLDSVSITRFRLGISALRDTSRQTICLILSLIVRHATELLKQNFSEVKLYIVSPINPNNHVCPAIRTIYINMPRTNTYKIFCYVRPTCRTLIVYLMGYIYPSVFSYIITHRSTLSRSSL
jgi:hypothetical protein